MSVSRLRIAARVATAALVVAGPGGFGRAHADHESIVPRVAGARSYFAPVPPGAGQELITDSLARGLWRAIGEAAREHRRKPPESDPRLQAVAEVLAATLRSR